MSKKELKDKFNKIRQTAESALSARATNPYEHYIDSLTVATEDLNYISDFINSIPSDSPLWQRPLRDYNPQKGSGDLTKWVSEDYPKGIEDTEHKYYGGFKVGDKCWIAQHYSVEKVFKVREATIKERNRYDDGGWVTVVFHVNCDGDNAVRLLSDIFKTEAEAQKWADYLNEIIKEKNDK